MPHPALAAACPSPDQAERDPESRTTRTTTATLRQCKVEAAKRKYLDELKNSEISFDKHTRSAILTAVGACQKGESPHGAGFRVRKPTGPTWVGAPAALTGLATSV